MKFCEKSRKVEVNNICKQSTNCQNETTLQAAHYYTNIPASEFNVLL